MRPGDLILSGPFGRSRELPVVEIATQLQRTDDHDGHEGAGASGSQAERLIGNSVLAGDAPKGAMIAEAGFVYERRSYHHSVFNDAVPIFEQIGSA